MQAAEHELGFEAVIFLKLQRTCNACLMLDGATSLGTSTNPANTRKLNFKPKAHFCCLCHNLPRNTLQNQVSAEIRRDKSQGGRQKI